MLPSTRGPLFLNVLIWIYIPIINLMQFTSSGLINYSSSGLVHNAVQEKNGGFTIRNYCQTMISRIRCFLIIADLIVCQNYCNTMQVLNHQTLMHELWFTVSLINMLHASVKHNSMNHVLQWNIVHWNTCFSETWFTETRDAENHDSLKHVVQWNMNHWIT